MENKNELNTEPAIRSAESTPQSAIRIPQSNDILIVEDGPVEAEMLRRILVRSGYRVTLATNGEDGLKALREHPYVLVISDIQMPLMNGYEMCRAIKLDEKLWGTPVILVTMLSEPRDIVRALDVGADSYLTKPYVEAIMLGRIRALLANPFRRKLAEERRKVQVEYGGESYDVAVGGQQMANLLLSVYENSLILNQELMRIQNQLNLLNDRLDEKVRERTAALQESEQKFMRFFMLISIPLGVVNRDGVIVYFNNRFTEIFGYTTDDVPTLKEYWQRVYPDESYRQWVVDSWGAAVAKAAKEGTDIEPAEYRMTCKSGAERVVMIGGILLEDNILATFVDITERKLAESQLNEQIEELRRWHEATLGREMRTLELKREVNELLVQAGQPPRYPSVEQSNEA